METGFLGYDLEQRRRVVIPHDARTRGTYVVGTTGSGKSTLLLHLIVQDMQAGYGLLSIDPHGEITQSILNRIPDHRQQDVRLLDVTNTKQPFGLNLFHCDDPDSDDAVAETHGRVMDIFLKIWGPGTPRASWGPQLEDLLSTITYTVIYNRETLMCVPRLLTDEAYRRRLTHPSHLRNPAVRDFWAHEYPHFRPDDRRSTLNKVRPFITTPSIRNIVCQKQSTINFREILEQGQIVLLRMPRNWGPTFMGLLGALFVANVSNTLFSPQTKVTKPFSFYADEFYLYATPDFEELISEARKFGLAMVLAHQYRSQLEGERLPHATLQMANQVYFQASSQADALPLAGKLDCTDRELRQIGVEPEWGFDPRPVERLLTSEHPSAAVRVLQRELRSLQRVLDKKPREISAYDLEHLHYLDVRDMQAALDNYEDAADLKQYVNDYLYARMRRDPDDAEAALRVVAMKQLGRFYSAMAPPQFWASATRLLLPHPSDRWTNDIRGALVARAVAEYGVVDRGRVEDALERLIDSVAGLKLAGDGIAKAPLYCHTGGLAPRYDRPEPPSVVQQRRANELVQLQPFKARCSILELDEQGKFRRAEYKLTTRRKPELASREQRFELLRFIYRNLASYTRFRDDVERELGVAVPSPTPEPEPVTIPHDAPEGAAAARVEGGVVRFG